MLSANNASSSTAEDFGDTGVAIIAADEVEIRTETHPTTSTARNRERLSDVIVCEHSETRSNSPDLQKTHTEAEPCASLCNLPCDCVGNTAR